MPFTVKNEKYSVIQINIEKTLILEEVKQILGILKNVLSFKKPFAFYLNFNVDNIPGDSATIAKYTVGWLKENKEDIKKYLGGSSLIIKSEKIVAIFNGLIFKIQPPEKPNLITCNYEKGVEFVTNIMKNL
jgi:hypothetical protein